MMTPSKHNGHGAEREQNTRFLPQDVHGKGKAEQEMIQHKEREGNIIGHDHTAQHSAATA